MSRLPYETQIADALRRELQRQLDLPRPNFEFMVRAIWVEMERRGYTAPALKSAAPVVKRRQTELGDVIQVVAEPGNPLYRWGGVLLIVDEVKNFGVRAFLKGPDGEAHLRLNWEDFRWTGGSVERAP